VTSTPASLDQAAMVFEALSPSTIAYDRGCEIAACLAPPVMRQMAIVYPGAVRIEAWLRDRAGAGTAAPIALKDIAGALPVPAIEASLPLAAICEAVVLDD
jgi:hypothetical protein